MSAEPIDDARRNIETLREVYGPPPGEEEAARLARVPEVVQKLWAFLGAIRGGSLERDRAMVARALLMVDPLRPDVVFHAELGLEPSVCNWLTYELRSQLGEHQELSRHWREAFRVACGFEEPQPPSWVKPGEDVFCWSILTNRRIMVVERGPAAHVLLAPEGSIKLEGADVIPMGLFLYYTLAGRRTSPLDQE